MTPIQCAGLGGVEGAFLDALRIATADLTAGKVEEASSIMKSLPEKVPGAKIIAALAALRDALSRHDNGVWRDIKLPNYLEGKVANQCMQVVLQAASAACRGMER